MKKIHIIFLLIGFYISQIKAQDTIFYNSDDQKVSKLELAKKYKVITKHNKDNIKLSVQIYNQNNNLIQEYFFEDSKAKKKTGTHKTWRDDGSIKTEIEYLKNKKDGTLKSFWPDGSLKRKDTYRKGKWVSGEVYDENQNILPYYEFEIRPAFPGGKSKLSEYIKTNYVRPYGAQVKGKILIQFLIRKDGSVVPKNIEQSLSPSADAAAIKLIEMMPAWNPGYIDGEAVEVVLTLPIVLN